MRGLATTLAMAPFLLITGCITSPHDHHADRAAPLPPAGVTSTTADRAVYLEWLPNREPDLEGYRVYVSEHPHGPYHLLAFTRRERYTDSALENGYTYYYGVSAVDRYGNESELNQEIIYDTPRPEGFGLLLYEADGPSDDLSAFDFSRERRTHWDRDEADVFFDWADGTPYLAVPDYATDIQDAGYAGFDDVTWAPEGGWAPSGFVEAIEGHVYVVWTRDDHYAKLRVIDVRSGRVEVDWAYQVDRGNPELRSVRRADPRPRPGDAREAS